MNQRFFRCGSVPMGCLVLLLTSLFGTTAFAFGDLLHTFNDPTVTDADQFGYSVSVDGNHVLIGAWQDSTNGFGVGQAYLFDIRVPEPGTGVLLVGMALVASGCRRRSSAL